MQHEALRCVRQLRLDDVAPEAHQLRVLVHQCAGAAIDRARGAAANLQSRLLEDAKRRHQDALHLLGAQDLQRRPSGWSAAAAARARGRWSAQRALLHVGGTLRELQSSIAFARLGLSRRYCDLRDARCKLGEWTASTTSSSVPALPVACLRTGCRPAAATGYCCSRPGARTGASGSGCRLATGVPTTTRTSTGCTKPSRMPGWTARAASGRAAKSSAAPARSTPWSTCADSLRILTTGRPAPMPAGAGPACGRYSNPWKIAPTVAPGSCG